MSKYKKPWGYEKILESNDNYTLKELFMKKNNQCSLQFHKKKKETIFVLEGTLFLYKEGIERTLNPGSYVTISPLEVHRMSACIGDVRYLEASTSELDDVIRLEDSYGRS